jgi:hypothetical protein
MTARLGRSEGGEASGRGTAGESERAPARRYASFVVRGWQPGRAGALVIAHDQSGDCVRTDSLVEAIGWMQAHALPASEPALAPMADVRQSGCGRANSAPDESVRGGAWQTRTDAESADTESIAAA